MTCDLCDKELDPGQCRSYDDVENSRLCEECFQKVTAGSAARDSHTAPAEIKKEAAVSTGTDSEATKGVPAAEPTAPVSAEQKEPAIAVVEDQKPEQRPGAVSYSSFAAKVIIAAAIILILPLATSSKVVLAFLVVAVFFGFMMQRAPYRDSSTAATPRCDGCGRPLSDSGLCESCDLGPATATAGLEASRLCRKCGEPLYDGLCLACGLQREAPRRCEKCGETLSNGLCLTCGLGSGSQAPSRREPASLLGCLGSVLLGMIGVAVLLFVLFYIVCLAGH